MKNASAMRLAPTCLRMSGRRSGRSEGRILTISVASVLLSFTGEMPERQRQILCSSATQGLPARRISDYGLVLLQRAGPLHIEPLLEIISIPIIISERFGMCSMSEDLFNALSQRNGYLANINGKTHIRAGVIRPEVFLQEG